MKKIITQLFGFLIGILCIEHIQAQCNLNVSFTYTLGANGSVSFSSTSTGTLVNTFYSWNFGSNTFSNGIAPTHTYNANGNYTIVLTATNPSVNPACQGSATVVITISSLTVTPCNLVAGCSYSFGPNGTVYFMTNTSTGTVPGTTYTLDFGDNTTANTIPTVHTYSANGSYTVTLTADNNFTNSCTSTKTFVVNYTCFMSVSTTASVICEGDTVTLTASGSTNYLWSTGTPGPSLTVSPLLTTVYTVSNQTFPCYTTTSSLTILVKPSPSITIISSPTAVCIGQSATLTANGASSYTWNGGNPNPVISVSPTTSTSYTVTGTSNQGCSSTKTINLSVLPLPTVVISPVSPTICAGSLLTLNASGATTYTWKPGNTNSASNSISPQLTSTYTVSGTDPNLCTGSSIINVIVEQCTGIADNGLLKNEVSFYPNPSSGFINCKFEFEGDKEMLITNSVGAIIKKVMASGFSESLDLSGQSKGVYFIRVSSSIYSSNYRIIIQ